MEQESGSTPSVFAAQGGAVMSKSRTTTSRLAYGCTFQKAASLRCRLSTVKFVQNMHSMRQGRDHLSVLSKKRAYLRTVRREMRRDENAGAPRLAVAVDDTAAGHPEVRHVAGVDEGSVAHGSGHVAA